MAHGYARRYGAGWLTGGLHVFIVFIAIEAKSVAAWPYALASMALVSFFAWIANYRRYRYVHDLPTSRIASAAQGYVELFGRARQNPDYPLKAPFSATPCCWFSYKEEAKGSDGKWSTQSSGESSGQFMIADDTGQAVLSPAGAEIVVVETKCWTQGGRRYTEELLLPDGPLYVLGEFYTIACDQLPLEDYPAVNQILTEWKNDQAKLLERFDTDRSGALSLVEWEQARLEARREVEQRYSGTRQGGVINFVRKPADGRIYILAAELPEKIGRRFALWGWAHLGLVFGAVTASFLLFKALP